MAKETNEIDGGPPAFEIQGTVGTDDIISALSTSLGRNNHISSVRLCCISFLYRQTNIAPFFNAMKVHPALKSIDLRGSIFSPVPAFDDFLQGQQYLPTQNEILDANSAFSDFVFDLVETMLPNDCAVIVTVEKDIEYRIFSGEFPQNHIFKMGIGQQGLDKIKEQLCGKIITQELNDEHHSVGKVVKIQPVKN